MYWLLISSQQLLPFYQIEILHHVMGTSQTILDFRFIQNLKSKIRSRVVVFDTPSPKGTGILEKSTNEVSMVLTKTP